VSLPETVSSVDMSLTSYTSGGDLALVGVLDLDALLQQDSDIDIAPAIAACVVPDSPGCTAAFKAAIQGVPQDKLKAAANWWHGCKHADDHQTKMLAGLPRKSLGYLIAAQAEDGSSAIVSGDLVFHATSPQPHTEQICGADQTGNMPSAGNYTNELVGHVSLVLTPQHGGTLSNARSLWIVSPVAKGHFLLHDNGNITFTGNVDVSNCPHPPLPNIFPGDCSRSEVICPICSKEDSN